MKLTHIGFYKSDAQLDKIKLPDEATKVVNQSSSTLLFQYILPIHLVFVLLLYVKTTENFINMINSIAIITWLFMVLVHELLHVIALPKRMSTKIWFSVKYGTGFVVFNGALNKYRFLFMSLLPNVILGILPLLVWLIFPFKNDFNSTFVFTFSYIGVMIGFIDYAKSINVIRKVPSNAVISMSEGILYWH